MQFNRDEAGTMHPLPKPSVDTGMGLERLTAVLQHVHSNYEIDLFQTLVKAAARETGHGDLASPSLRVIADHIRACAFLICDGVIPGNEGRGYVLRRIARRAMRHGYKLGRKQPFFYKLVGGPRGGDGRRLPGAARGRGARDGHAAPGGGALRRDARERHGDPRRRRSPAAARSSTATPPSSSTTPTASPWTSPPTSAASAASPWTWQAFDAAMAAQQERSRAASKFKAGAQLEYSGARTAFRGYETLSEEGRVVALYREGSPVKSLAAGEAGIVVLDRTPFYAESGGQVGDRGELTKGGVCLTLFAVEDTQKIQPDVFGHYGTVKTGELAVGDTVAAQVDLDRRARTMRHHSVTHLMHKALREVLGPHVQQKGSLVDEDKTRFDFSHNAPMTAAEIRRVEEIVNAEILANAATQARVMPIDDAQKIGAMMLFGEKYGDEVRVLDIGTSRELCGGTHVARTGDIGYFRIVSEGGVAAGIRRVEAIAGSVALALAHADRERLARAAEALKAQPQEIDAKIAQVVENVKALEKEVAKLKGQLAAGKLDDVLAAGMRTIKGVKTIAMVLDGADAGMLRDSLDKVKERLGSGVAHPRLRGRRQGVAHRRASPRTSRPR